MERSDSIRVYGGGNIYAALVMRLYREFLQLFALLEREVCVKTTRVSGRLVKWKSSGDKRLVKRQDKQVAV